MNTEPTTHRCPKCHALLPAGAPAGLCPKCLLAAAATPTEPGRPALDAPPPPLSAVAAAFPQLEILELIGQGGMGVVYKARQPRLDRLVALKLLPQALAADATFAERFNREARVLARLNHANIVTVHDFGQADGFFYLLMEYVDGVNLRQAMQAGRFTPQQAMLLVPKICEALQFAHDEGILHRDIKPENILLDARGRVKIADFGIAKLVGEAKDKITLTASGMAVGTPHYMAPEQLEHPQDVDQRADIYSLGVVFYEMLTGELPIGRFAPPSQKSPVDPRVDEVVLRALEKERERRQHNITEVRTQVEQIAATPAEGTPATPVSTAVTAPGLGRKAICYFSTPERMRNCFPGPQAHVFKCKGELRLEGEQLTFISPWQTRVVIPLREIRELSIGQFQMWTTPWVMKYERLNFLSVVFSAGGSLRTVFLTPVPPLPAPPARINAEVSGWFEAIQQAVAGLTGAAPPQLAPSAATIRAQRSWMRRASPWMFAPLAAWVVGILNMRSANGASAAAWAAIFALTLALCTGLIWFSVGFLRANYALRRGDLDAVTSDEPPDEPSWDVPSAPKQASRPARPFWWTVSAWAFLVIGVIAVIDTLAALYTRPLNPAFYPGLAHLFAGLALLTRSRIWRAVAVLALTLASAGAVFLAVAVAVAPEHGTITLPMLGLNIPV
ncbi:MAG TPA: serine/threonine-protein kinase, partial [Candidatus Acidoferrum sp.]|nr:serine/threonine-protein kinase [Candidatus Acidoferrum sp.]